MPVPEHSSDEDLRAHGSDDDMRSLRSQNTSAGDSEDEQPCVVADAAVAAPGAVRSVAQERHIQQLNKFHQWLHKRNTEEDDDDDGGAGTEAEFFHMRAFSTYTAPADERVTATAIRKVLWETKLADT